MLNRAFQIVLVILVALFTVVGLIMLFAALESALVASLDIHSFTRIRSGSRGFGLAETTTSTLIQP